MPMGTQTAFIESAEVAFLAQPCQEVRPAGQCGGRAGRPPRWAEPQPGPGLGTSRQQVRQPECHQDQRLQGQRRLAHQHQSLVDDRAPSPPLPIGPDMLRGLLDQHDSRPGRRARTNRSNRIGDQPKSLDDPSIGPQMVLARRLGHHRINLTVSRQGIGKRRRTGARRRQQQHQPQPAGRHTLE